MRIFLICAFLLIVNFCYSQINTSAFNTDRDFNVSVQDTTKSESSLNEKITFNTPAIFSITFYENKKVLLSSNKYSSYDKVYLDNVSDGYLTFRQKYPFANHPNAITTMRRIAIKDIKSLGYATHSQETFGTLLGMGIGALGGAIVTALGNSWGNSDDAFNVTSPNWDNSGSALNTGSEKKYITPIIVWTLSGAALGYLIGSNMNSYETFDLAKYDNNDRLKIGEIKRIIKAGLNYKREK